MRWLKGQWIIQYVNFQYQNYGISRKIGIQIKTQQSYTYTTQFRNMSSTAKPQQASIQKHQTVSPDEETMVQEKSELYKTASTGADLEHSQAGTSTRKHTKARRAEIRLIMENAKAMRCAHPDRRHAHAHYIQPDAEIEHGHAITGAPNKKRKIGKCPKRTGSKCRSKLDSDNQNHSPIMCQFDTQGSDFPKKSIQNVRFKGLQLTQSVAEGTIGYSTLMFNSKIVEGAYYLELKVLKPQEGTDYKHKPDIRVGLCDGNHKLDTPLGYGNSIGFSVGRKCVFQQGVQQKINFYEPMDELQIVPGDVIGMQVQFSPPHRLPDQSKLWQDSSLTFYLNGRQLAKYERVKQMFYHPALSLYNGYRVHIRTRAEQMSFRPDHCSAMSKLAEFINNYK